MENNANDGSKQISDEHKIWIDNASYMEMLKKMRFAVFGDPMFSGKTGEYFFRVMREKKNELQPGEAANISELIGWD